MKPNAITIHCSATKPSQDIDIKDLRKIHVEDRGWSDVGYHFLIRRSGEIQVGRPMTRNGAHVLGYNKNNIGVCLAGGLDEDGNTYIHNLGLYTDNQYVSLKLLVNLLMGMYHIPLHEVAGHREYYGKDRDDWLKMCPCIDIYRIEF